MGLKIKIEEKEASLFTFILTPILAFLFAFLVGGILMKWAGVSPIDGYSAFLGGAFGSPRKLADTLVRMVPFLLMGVGIALSNRGNVLNIGAEGQFIMGAIAATWISMLLQDFTPWPIITVIAFFLSLGVGGIWGGIAGYLKAKMGINEVVTTVMMNWLAFKLLQWLLRGPLKNPESEMWPMSPPIKAEMPIVIPGTRLHLGFVVSILAAYAVYYLLFKTSIGFKLRACGKNPFSARYAGYNVENMIILSMIISGGLAGLAGSIEVMGVHHFLYEGISVGLGYTAIIVSLVGKDHPIAIIPSSFIFGAIYNGVVYLQATTGLSYTFSKALEGMIYIFVLISELLARYRIRIG